MFCQKCGGEIMDEAVICPKCGCETNSRKQEQSSAVKTAEKEVSTLYVVAKVFMIIACVASATFLIALCWTIPMTVSFSRKIERGEKVGVGFKICSLLFVNPIAGILMLCSNN